MHLPSVPLLFCFIGESFGFGNYKLYYIFCFLGSEIMCTQVRLYGDGADAQQHFELMSLLAVLGGSSSTLDSRLALSIRNSNRTSSEARTLICEVIAWSFDSLRTLVERIFDVSFGSPEK
jgi:hypothetical protein